VKLNPLPTTRCAWFRSTWVPLSWLRICADFLRTFQQKRAFLKSTSRTKAVDLPRLKRHNGSWRRESLMMAWKSACISIRRRSTSFKKMKPLWFKKSLSAIKYLTRQKFTKDSPLTQSKVNLNEWSSICKSTNSRKTLLSIMNPQNLCKNRRCPWSTRMIQTFGTLCKCRCRGTHSLLLFSNKSLKLMLGQALRIAWLVVRSRPVSSFIWLNLLF